MKPVEISIKKVLPELLGWLLLVILFLRTIWGMWEVKDITSGDTSSYYITALQFSKQLVCNIAWSPIYTSYLGAWHWINPDPYFVVIAHRIGILALLAVLIYLVSRRLLSQPFAWLVTAWWLVLPINYDALYEVHLFALIPICLFWLLLSISSRLEMRGACIGFLVACTFLIRNELLIALVLFTSLSLTWDYWEYRKGKSVYPASRYLLAYGVPICVALILIGVSYLRSTKKFPELSGTLREKHTLNLSQIYTFGYGQRHPEFLDDPWVGYKKLMIRDFGRDALTMKEATIINPKAMLEHFWWNAVLIPNGLQVALFNCRGGEGNPDYAPTYHHYPKATFFSVLYCVLVAIGMTLLMTHWAYWSQTWLEKRAWLLSAIVSVCLTVIVVMVMQRPRPSYLFPQSLALMWLAGFSLQIIFHHIRCDRILERLFFVPMLAITLLVPRGFSNSPINPPSRPLLTQLRLLEDYKNKLKNGAVVGGYSFELQAYLGLGDEPKKARLVDLATLLGKPNRRKPLGDVLREAKIKYLILPYNFQQDGRVMEFQQNAATIGWEKARSTKDFGKDYSLYIRKARTAVPSFPIPPVVQ